MSRTSPLRAARAIVAMVVIGFLTACSANPPAARVIEESVQAQLEAVSIEPFEIVEIPTVLPLPGQLKSMPAQRLVSEEAPSTAAPSERIEQANAAARREPMRERFVNANQVWPYSPDALYQVYTRPERITDIALEPGESLISVSAGDTVRWIIGDSTSGSGEDERVHILLKPIGEDLNTNLVIHTDRRAYHLELSSTTETWLAAVSWTYPLDDLHRRKRAQQRATNAAPLAEGIALDRLAFSYEISGDTPSWRPVRAFDDGEKVYIQFPSGIGQGEMPPLFVRGQRGDTQLVNYRVRSPYYIVDRLFESAELRLGDRRQDVVRITRSVPRATARRGRNL